MPISAIAVSSGQNDAGVFELNFKDERYLPFEGAGAVSKWEIELPSRIRQFDYGSITDVVVHIRYTSVDGGQTLKDEVEDYVEKALNETKKLANDEGLFVVLDLKHDFHSHWPRFSKGGDNAKIDIGDMLKDRIPYYLAHQVSKATVHQASIISLSEVAGSAQMTIDGKAISIGNGVPIPTEVGVEVKDGLSLELHNQNPIDAFDEAWLILKLVPEFK